MKRLKLLSLLPGILILTACIAPATPPSSSPPTATTRPALTTTRAPTRSPAATTTYNSDGTFLLKDPAAIRVMTYNVNWDSIFPDDDPQNHDFRAFNRVDAFGRILRAIEPDVLCLQEINDRRSPRDIGDYLARMVDAPDDPWNVVHVSNDVIASPMGLRQEGYELVTGSMLANLDQAAALIDLPDSEYASTDLYMICSHFKSGGSPTDISLRQRQADVIMANVRDFETPGGNLDLPYGTPFVILGDFNVYNTDPALQLRTLTKGDISNERSFGLDLEPDWDGTPLEDAMPSQNDLGADFYTWRNDSEPFDPWALDRVIFSDSVLQVRNAFVLNTAILPQDILTAHGLQRDDVILDPGRGNYDHLPVVVDFQFDSPE